MGVPILDPYADLPELRGRSPEEQQRLILQASFRRGDAAWFLPFVGGLAAALAWGAVGGYVAYLMIKANPAANGKADPRMVRVAATLVVGGAVVVWMVVGLLVRRSLIIRSIRNMVNRVACPYCRFSLIGLQVEGVSLTSPQVRCPECGALVDLFENGLVPADLLTEEQRRRPLAGAGQFGAYKPPSVKDKRAGAAKGQPTKPRSPGSK